jgi:hypothetical protein
MCVFDYFGACIAFYLIVDPPKKVMLNAPQYHRETSIDNVKILS